jgi:hypothetical protein
LEDKEKGESREYRVEVDGREGKQGAGDKEW